MTYPDRCRILSVPDADPGNDFRIEFQKASGNGGQKINKTSSSVRITHIPSGLSVRCMDSRSQSRNRSLALSRLKRQIAITQLIPLTEISLEERDFVLEPVPSVNHPRYVLWLADFFDLLFSCSADLHKAAELLQTSSSRIIRILQRDPALWRDFISLKKQRGLLVVSDKNEHKKSGNK